MAAPPRLLMIDNVDSFTFMLVDYLRVAGAEVAVARSDAVAVDEALGDEIDGIVISPGPGRPEDAGCSVAVAAGCIVRRKPLTPHPITSAEKVFRWQLQSIYQKYRSIRIGNPAFKRSVGW